MRHLQKRATDRPDHPTRLQLLEITEVLLKTKSASSITTEEVLELSGISRGSLYHHFNDLADLIDTALARRFTSLIVQRTKVTIKPLFQQASTRDEVLQAFRKIALLWSEPDSTLARTERITLLARATSNPALKEKIADQQQRLSDLLTDVVRDLQTRGLMRADFAPYAASLLLQAWSFGLALNEAAERQVDPRVWIELVVSAFEKTFLCATESSR